MLSKHSTTLLSERVPSQSSKLLDYHATSATPSSRTITFSSNDDKPLWLLRWVSTKFLKRRCDVICDVKARHARHKSNPTNISAATIVCDGFVGDIHLPIDPGRLNCKSGSSGFAAPFKNFRPLGTPGWSSHRVKRHYCHGCSGKKLLDDAQKRK